MKATKCGKDRKYLCQETERALKKHESTFLVNQAEETLVADATKHKRNIYHIIGSFNNKSKDMTGTIFSKDRRNPITAIAETLDR